jgi:hypothetical protein
MRVDDWGDIEFVFCQASLSSTKLLNVGRRIHLEIHSILLYLLYEDAKLKFAFRSHAYHPRANHTIH